MYKFFSATIKDNQVEMSGQRDCRLGSPVEFNGRIHGPFCNWNWNGEELTANVDALGLFGLFYYVDHDSIMISPSPIQLISLGASSELDPIALAVFSMTGWYLKQDTPFKHIKILPPGGRLLWKNGQISVNGSYFFPSESSMSRRHAVEGFTDIFRPSMKNQLDSISGEILLPLSGGRDSRHILFEMLNSGRKPDVCITYGSRNSQDPEIVSAMEVARATQVVHEILDNHSTPIQDQIQAFLLTHFCSDEHSQYMALRSRAARNGGLITVFDGIGGDILTRNKSFTNLKVYDLCRNGKWDEAVDVGIIQGNNKINESGFQERSNEISRGHFQDAQNLLIDNLREFEAAADPWTPFLFTSRTRREISLIATSILGDKAIVRCPYLDLDLTGFLLSIPFHITSDGKFHDEIISTAFPEYSEIPYENNYKAVWRRRSVIEKVLAITNGLSASSFLGPAYQASLLRSQISNFFHGSGSSLLKWRLYNSCLDATCSIRGATNFMEHVDRLVGEG